MRKTKKIISLVVALVVLSVCCFSANIGTNVNAADNNNDDWLHSKGDKIYDKYGNEVWLTGANWFGFNCSENVFHGSWYDVKGILNSIADKGIGFLRVPISTELLYSWMIGKPNKVSSVTAANDPPYMVLNPDFYDAATKGPKDSMQIFDIIMGYCKELGIKVMIDIHSPHADNSGHMYPLWYGQTTKTAGTVTTDMWIDTIVWLTEKYKNDDTILAMDLKNEPHGKRGYTGNSAPSDMAKWDNSTDENNWKYAAEKCGKAVLKANPNMLIMIEGVEQYPKTEKGYTYDTPDVWEAKGDAAPWHGAWWGGNLRGVKDYPIDFGSLNSQIVYSPHDYGPSVYNQSWFDKDFTTQTLLDDYWYDTWAYIDAEGIAPLLIGEWGGHMDAGKNQKWMTLLRDYMIKNRINHTFWCINPNSGDTGGLIGNDWSTWDAAKYALLKPALWQTNGGKFIGLDHQIPLGKNGISLGEYYHNATPSSPEPTKSATPKPTATPTPTVKATPTNRSVHIVCGYINVDFSYSAGKEVKKGFNIGIVPGTYSTDKDGYFEITRSPGGFTNVFDVTISKPGYLTREIKNVKAPQVMFTTVSGKDNPLIMWAGDLNGDGAINMTDIVEVARSFNTSVGNAQYSEKCDFNMDGAINMTDVMTVANHFNYVSSNYQAQ